MHKANVNENEVCKCEGDGEAPLELVGGGEVAVDAGVHGGLVGRDLEHGEGEGAHWNECRDAARSII